VDNINPLWPGATAISKNAGNFDKGAPRQFVFTLGCPWGNWLSLRRLRMDCRQSPKCE